MNVVQAITGFEASNILFFCGAGISYDAPTRLPTVNSFIHSVLSECGADPDVRDAVAHKMSVEQVTPRFEVLIDEIRKLRDPSLKIGAVFNSAAFNRIHHFLGRMLLEGASVITTNFDNCIENSLRRCRGYERVVFTGSDLSTFPPCTGALIKVHGSHSLKEERAEVADLVISIKALARTAQGFARFPNWQVYLNQVLSNRLVVVIGYSGSDDFDMTPVLLDSKPARVLWFDYSAKHSFPVLSRKTENHKVARFAAALPLSYFRGQLSQLLGELERSWGISPDASRGKRPAHTVKSYVDSLFAAPSRKEELINQILLHYALYEMTVGRKLRDSSSEIVIQKMKALYRMGRHQETCELYDQHRRRFRNRAQRLQALYYQSAALYHLGRLDEALSVAQAQLGLARSTRDPAALIHSLNNLGAIHSARGEYDMAEARYSEVLLPQNDGASIEGVATALWGLADVALIRDDDAARAFDLYTRARGIYADLGNNFTLGWADHNIGEALIRMRRLDEAEAALDAAEAAFREPYYPPGLLYALNARGKVKYLRGELNHGVAALSEGLEIIEQHPRLPIALDVLMLYACAMIKMGHRQILNDKLTVLLSTCQGGEDDQRVKLLWRAVKNSFRKGSIPSLEKYIFG